MPISPIAGFARRAVVAMLLAGMPAIAAAQQEVRLTLGAYREQVMLDTLRQFHDLRAKPADVYQATLKAFEDLGVPTGRTDGKSGIIGSERFERVRNLGSMRLSKLFDCGESGLGAYADSFRLEIAVAAWVSPGERGTKLGLAAVASGRDVSGAIRPKQCPSTGELEKRIASRVSELVGG